MQPEFAPTLLSVLMDTALASATQTPDQQGGNLTVSSGVSGGDNGGGRGGEAVNGGRHQRRRGLLPVVESHAGVANALDPLTSSTSFALTCQDVEVCVYPLISLGFSFLVVSIMSFMTALNLPSKYLLWIIWPRHDVFFQNVCFVS